MAKLRFQNKSVLFISRAGCFLPLALLFNLFFGWIFFRPLTWLFIEGILILLLVLNSYIIARKISPFPPPSQDRRRDVIDVEGKVIDDKHKEE